MNYGVTNTGFVVKREAEITGEIFDQLDALWGIVKRNPESVIGQIVGVLSRPYVQLWLRLEELYMSTDPDSAEGILLDNLCKYKNIYRRSATGTSVVCSAFGTINTIIPKGTQVGDKAGNIFSTISETHFIDNMRNFTKFKILELGAPAFNRTVVLASGTYTFSHVTSNETDPAIWYSKFETALKEAVDDGLLPYGLHSKYDADNEEFDLISSGYSTFSIKMTVGLETLERGFPLPVVCDTVGDIHVKSGDIDTVITATIGFDSVKNFSTGITGSFLESDNELRMRRRLSKRTGSNNSQSIEVAIENNIIGVQKAVCYENDTSAVVDGMKPHSILVVVDGGVGRDQEIAELIWTKKATGIATNGNISKIVIDSKGTSREILFGRPEIIYGKILVEITTIDADFVLPQNFSDIIATEIAEEADTLQIGEDFSSGRYISYAYKLKGVVGVTVKVAVSSDPINPHPTWVEGTISVTKLQRVVVLDKNSVTVLKV